MPRTLPQAGEAELAVLGAVLLRGVDALNEARGHLQAEDFYQPRAEAIWSAMLIVAEQGLPIDVLTLEAQLRKTAQLELVGGIEGLARIDRYATAHNIAAHCELVADAALRRRLAIYHREQFEALMSDDEIEDSAEWTATALAEHARIASATSRTASLITIKDACMSTMQQLTARADGSQPVVRSGFDCFDNTVRGMLPGELVVLGGRSGHGKTAFAMSMARNCAFYLDEHGSWQKHEHPIPVFYASSEQNDTEIVQRWLAQLCSIDGSLFRSPSRKFMQTHVRSIIRELDRLSSTPITIGYRKGRYQIAQACADARVWRRKIIADHRRRWRAWLDQLPADERAKHPTTPPDPPGLIVFDYLQRFGMPRHLARETRDRQLSEAVDMAKDLAGELGVPAVMLSQVNKRADDRPGGKPTIADLRECGAIENTADMVGLLYRAERYHPQRDERLREFRVFEHRLDRGERLELDEQKRHLELLEARMSAQLIMAKVRGAESDLVLPFEFMPEFVRFLDQPKRR